MSIRTRLALWLCRAAGLHEVAVAREQLDAVRAEHQKLAALYSAHVKMQRTMSVQLNTNTLMMKRWHDSSPALQMVEKAAKGKRSMTLPPLADLRTASNK